MTFIRDIRTVKEHKSRGTLSINLPKSLGFEAGQKVLVVVIDEWLEELTEVVIKDKGNIITAECKVDNPALITKLNNDAKEMRLIQNLPQEEAIVTPTQEETTSPPNTESIDKPSKEAEPWSTCPMCSYVVNGDKPFDKCPICGQPRG